MPKPYTSETKSKDDYKMICFHHNDLDGRCAAAIVDKWWRPREAEGQREIFVELDYKDRVPVESIGPSEQVVIVDFSFKPEVMSEVFKRTDKIIWCDHHKTAANYDYGRELAGIRDFEEKHRAGCEVTWEFFFPDIPIPKAVFLVGDRDCWRWQGGVETARFNQGMKLYDTSPASPFWRVLLDEGCHDNKSLLRDITEQGRTCLMFRDSFCADYAKTYGFETEFEGHKAFAMGLYMFGSEGFGEKFKQYPMCLSFVFDGEQWTVGLYSETIDVGEIARKHGGGGHKGAAGFVSAYLPFNANAGRNNA